MYKPVWLDARDRVVWLGVQGKAEQQLGGAERRLGGSERRLGGSERRLGRAGEAAELCGAAELLGAQGKAEQRLGGAERRLGRAGEVVELCGAAELLGVPLTGFLMPHLVLSTSKQFVCSPEHACECIDGAIVKLAGQEGEHLTWVLM